ncbi:hypothetical protein HK102_008639 [Quaeritorhiza haematococci]|nr:hypothetical protein HK102_008639 [Quaeritorhiza haematococci]
MGPMRGSPAMESFAEFQPRSFFDDKSGRRGKTNLPKLPGRRFTHGRVGADSGLRGPGLNIKPPKELGPAMHRWWESERITHRMAEMAPFLCTTSVTPVVVNFAYDEQLNFFLMDDSGRLLLYLNMTDVLYLVANTLQDGLRVLKDHEEGGLADELERVDEGTGMRTGDQLGLGCAPFVLTIKGKPLQSMDECETHARQQIRDQAIFVKDKPTAFALLSSALKTVKKWNHLTCLQVLVYDEGRLHVVPHYRDVDEARMQGMLARYSKKPHVPSTPQPSSPIPELSPGASSPSSASQSPSTP